MKGRGDAYHGVRIPFVVKQSYRRGGGVVAKVRVERETEIDRGWSFDIAVAEAPAAPGENGAAESRHTLVLNWADYDLWSHGASRPERVAEAVALFYMDRAGEALPARPLDAATVRRRFPEIDRELPAML